MLRIHIFIIFFSTAEDKNFLALAGLLSNLSPSTVESIISDLQTSAIEEEVMENEGNNMGTML